MCFSKQISPSILHYQLKNGLITFTEWQFDPDHPLNLEA